ncbi:MarR family winged helix-turn-helix transcriptional regulator [Microbacterium sp. NPDC090007]|uniref:MarR family winged helix-turn-helix transcriptional regulator n=1 Tax=Microbacterium sp. NPDC090007 TaxID=3364204 RepID=UPI003820D531
MKRDDTSPPPYWYGESAEDDRGTRVMEALRAYRAAEMSMRRQTQAAMAMGENELLVLRFLTRANSSGRDVTPIDLARHLVVSTASVTAMLDRLERSGHVIRTPHPSDRRKVIVSSTIRADDEMRQALAAMHARMMHATRAMSAEQAEVVTTFLQRMRCAVADDCEKQGTGCCGAVRMTSAPLSDAAA